jgi:hypothetical protein
MHACMHVCMYAYVCHDAGLVCVCMHVRWHVRVPIRQCVYVCEVPSACEHFRVRARVCLYVSVCVYACAHKDTSMCTSVREYARMFARWRLRVVPLRVYVMAFCVHLFNVVIVCPRFVALVYFMVSLRLCVSSMVVVMLCASTTLCGVVPSLRENPYQ